MTESPCICLYKLIQFHRIFIFHDEYYFIDLSFQIFACDNNNVTFVVNCIRITRSNIILNNVINYTTTDVKSQYPILLRQTANIHFVI